jgi:hypothetical protein
LRRGALAAALALLVAWPWLRNGAGWPALAVVEIDYCRALGCDFAWYYLPQIHALYEAPGEVVRGWLYPPLLAILLQGLKWLPAQSAVYAWTALNAGFAAGLGAICYRELPRGPVGALGAAALVSLSLPVLNCLVWGQLSIAIALGAAAALARPWRGAGALLGFLAALKIYPGLYLGVPLLRRRWREVGGGAATAALAGVAAPVLALGWSAAKPFFVAPLTVGRMDYAFQGGRPCWPRPGAGSPRAGTSGTSSRRSTTASRCCSRCPASPR